ISDSNKLREYSKEQSDIQETVEVYREYKDVREQLKDAKAMLEDKLDAEMREMVKEEVSELESQEKTLSERLKILLVPKDP
ncbi:PCRF domain-containing protein, partial [Staphylococcus aureus]